MNELYHLALTNGTLRDGYAPFCKLLYVENFTDAISGFVKLTPEMEPFIRSAYEARRSNELPVLVRWVD